MVNTGASTLLNTPKDKEGGLANDPDNNPEGGPPLPVPRPIKRASSVLAGLVGDVNDPPDEPPPSSDNPRPPPDGHPPSEPHNKPLPPPDEPLPPTDKSDEPDPPSDNTHTLPEQLAAKINIEELAAQAVLPDLKETMEVILVIQHASLDNKASKMVNDDI
ncbi:hypothetical protein BDN67DRAFT_1014188 [Paxillus ammoniavirescens]|nr:hypothetical protein BDN67DRAFT_1014188 [Paxillus ammoniavirescens]